jgi:hypothetical protein
MVFGAKFELFTLGYVPTSLSLKLRSDSSCLISSLNKDITTVVLSIIRDTKL